MPQYTFEEAEKSQEQIANEMTELQEKYDLLLDPELIEYIEATQRVDTMSQAEFQIMQNYEYLNKDRLNKLNDLISQKIIAPMIVVTPNAKKAI